MCVLLSVSAGCCLILFIVYGRGKPAQTRPTDNDVPLKPPDRLNLADQYIGLLLLVLVKAGLLDVCLDWFFLSCFTDSLCFRH